MTLSELQQIATKADLQDMETRLFGMLQSLQQKVSEGLDNGPGPKTFYSPKEFAHLIGVSRPTVSRWCMDGTLKATQQGGRGTLWLIPHSELIRLQEDADSLQPSI